MPKWNRKNYRYVVEPDAFRYESEFIDKLWYRPLEVLVENAVFHQYPDAIVKKVAFCPMTD